MGDVQKQRFGDVSTGDHIIFIYDDTPELTAFAVPFLKEGLAKGERCLYILGDLGLAEATEALAAGGVDVNKESQRGALEVITGE
ncbi:MAG TPA: MEDS domain-containing protein, partial [Candidatus Acidoferrales bacterium]|nr:MEDS domain-containing protein [Candidatus Acidoferrales bacterium]